MYLVNNRYLWYVEWNYNAIVSAIILFNWWHYEISFTSKCRFHSLTKITQYSFSEYVRYSQFLIRFLLKYYRTKWIINIFFGIAGIIVTKIIVVTKKEKQTHKLLCDCTWNSRLFWNSIKTLFDITKRKIVMRISRE